MNILAAHAVMLLASIAFAIALVRFCPAETPAE